MTKRANIDDVMVPDAEIEAAYRQARQVWPYVALLFPAFQARVREGDVSREGLRVSGGDLFLACAAGDGDGQAIAAIDRICLAGLPGRILRLGSRAATPADVLQVVRTRLFAGPSPRIRSYNAAAPLERWIKVVAIRTAIDFQRQAARVSRVEDLWSRVGASSTFDAVTGLMQARYKKEFEAAVQAQLATLSFRDRTVLRLHVVEAMSVEKIARAYGVHRVTVARWIWNAGEILLDGLRDHFKKYLGIVPAEFDSVARLMRSQISVDLATLLRTE
jgi:RNA polymerase sigma-70 factor, ECF subfamily